MKLPGTYLAYAGLMAVFGQTTAGIHRGLLAVNMLAILLPFLLVRNVLDETSAVVAVISFSIQSVSPSVLGMSAHATHFVALFGVAGSFVLWPYSPSSRCGRAFHSGLLFGRASRRSRPGE